VIGHVIGNYRVVSELGKGGMGVVYVAEHVQLGRRAALKMLLPQFSSDETIVQRFFNEARAASTIAHPGIVEIYDFGRHTDGRAYLVMALLEGESLQDRMTRAPLAPVEGATLVAQVASTLAAAHGRGIVHRDLKPDNIFLVPNELMPYGVQAKLLDFGIAKLTDEQASFKTQTGSLIGTPAYMSPEQCMGRSDVDHRTDLYALGCILCHVLCGRPPFISDAGAGPLIAAHLRDPAPDPRTLNPQISEPLAHIVLRLLQKDPAARFQSAIDLREALMLAGANVSASRPMQAETQPTTGRHRPEAYAPTTASGSAAQVLAKPVKTSHAGVWIALGLVALAGGAVAFFVLSSKPKAEPVANLPPPAPAVPPVITDAAVALEACPPGQVRGDDTQGHCCWPEQAWSSARNQCLGTPRCPEGMTVLRGESCVASTPEPATTGSPIPRFTLEKQTYAPGERVTFQFAAPVPSSGTRQAWVTIVNASAGPNAYSTWAFVANQARTATLLAPKSPGNYEARIHTDYATKMFNLRYHVAFLVEPLAERPVVEHDEVTSLAQQRFTLAAQSVERGGTFELAFPTPLVAIKGERFWITVVPAGATDASYGAYEYVAKAAKTAKLATPVTAGAYEVRLHANYPTKSTNVVYRVTAQVR
jgi:Protein kinase domain